MAEIAAWRKAYPNGDVGEWRVGFIPMVVLEDANIRKWYTVEYAYYWDGIEKAVERIKELEDLLVSARQAAEEARNDYHRCILQRNAAEKKLKEIKELL